MIQLPDRIRDVDGTVAVEIEYGRAHLRQPRSAFEGDSLPVTNVSWGDCQEFCVRSGLSLPSEAQWEYACRAGTIGRYAGTGELDDMGWYYANSGNRPHTVGEKPPNQFGLHDMHGNVTEWCQDMYDAKLYGTDDALGTDPVSETGNGNRVIRGGSYGSSPWVCASDDRAWMEPERSDSTVGFRAVFWPLP